MVKMRQIWNYGDNFPLESALANTKANSRMSLCLYGVAVIKVLSLKELDRSEVGLYMYICQSLLTSTNMCKT